jgi:hypothetical protein
MEMRKRFEQPANVGLAALILVLAMIGYAISFVRQGEHFREMEAFMAKGDRFTGRDGREMAERIDLLEERIMLLEANSGHE